MEISSSSSLPHIFSLILLSSCFLLITYSLPLMKPLCHDEERFALLQFKQSFSLNLLDSTCSATFPKLSSWKIEHGNDNCCSWDGVECDDDTGYVIGLDLSSSCLYGSIDSNSSLFRLVRLRKLNLAYNNFNYSRIPHAIGQLIELRYLNLSVSQFSGQIPNAISKLNNLSVLDLSHNVDFVSGKPIILSLGNQALISNLTRLERLRLDTVNISFVVPDFFANFSSLKVLTMSYCQLHGKFPEKIFRLQNLERINLEGNRLLYGYFPEFEPNNSLKVIWLPNTGFYGNFPFSIGNLLSLTTLNLGQCSFSGLIPSSLGNLIELEQLDLLGNKLSGPLPSSLGNLTQLKFLQLCYNDFNDKTSLSWFRNLVTLNFLCLSGLNLQSNVLSSLGNLRQLAWLFLGDNPLFDQFPSSIHNMSSLMILNMDHTGMIGMLPQWLGNFSNSLKVLSLNDNMLEGSIPDTFGKENNFNFIDLSNNQLQGRLPRSLSNCEMLEIFVLKNNKLNDIFPSWLGTLPNLRILILQSNQFHGAIGEPKTDSEFPQLHVIDLSYNNFSSNLPFKYIDGWNVMKTFSSLSKYSSATTGLARNNSALIFHYFYSMTITIKGSNRDFPRIQEVFTVIDLSCNRFEGEIPYSFGNLKGLQSLNLSHNMLTGQIPLSLGNMRELESLDLSHNNLSGNIPSQLLKLTFLAIFNVSYNHLSGLIPQGNQLNSMDNSSYVGNSGLCGVPLSNKCGDSIIKQGPFATSEQGKDDESETSFFEFGWKIVLIGYGCGVVFGMVVGNCIITWKQEWFFKIYRFKSNVRRNSRRMRQRNRC